MGNKDILDEELTEAKEGEFKIDWKRKLTSRKLWMAIALFVSGIFAATGHKDTGVILLLILLVKVLLMLHMLVKEKSIFTRRMKSNGSYRILPTDYFTTKYYR